MVRENRALLECSDGGQRQVPSSGYLGYARTSEVVRDCHVLSSIYTYDFSHRDAWNKQKDLTPLEAKWLYVDALLKVGLLRIPPKC